MRTTMCPMEGKSLLGGLLLRQVVGIVQTYLVAHIRLKQLKHTNYNNIILLLNADQCKNFYSFL